MGVFRKRKRKALRFGNPQYRHAAAVEAGYDPAGAVDVTQLPNYQPGLNNASFVYSDEEHNYRVINGGRLYQKRKKK